LKNICSILIRNNDDSYSHLGIGFLVSREGLIITAAHVFCLYDNYKDRLICAFLNQNIKESPYYKFEPIYHEHRYPDHQKKPVIKDLAIGKINYQSSDFLVLNRKRPSLNQKLKALGYINNNRTNNKFYLNKNNTINLENLIEDNLEDTSLIDRFAYIKKPPVQDYNQLNTISFREKFNNCFTIKSKLHKGASGCPVIDEKGLVCGIFFGGHKTITTYSYFLAAKYLCEKIHFFTSCQFDMYQDLEYRI
jgi:hypothetical protein